MTTNKINVVYPGAFLPAFPFHKFEVYVGVVPVVPRQKYRPSYVGQASVVAGAHILEIRAINELTGRRRSSLFNIDIPDRDNVTLELSISGAWASWREPRVRW